MIALFTVTPLKSEKGKLYFSSRKLLKVKGLSICTVVPLIHGGVCGVCAKASSGCGSTRPYTCYDLPIHTCF